MTFDCRRRPWTRLGVGILAVALSASLAARPDEEEKAWDVNNPPGPTSEIAIKTSSGTWMSLDVSPDGREIVFDLLGDIYLLPMTGGKAKSLTSGMAWDIQPQFSPDGQSIAFTSDRYAFCPSPFVNLL